MNHSRECLSDGTSSDRDQPTDADISDLQNSNLRALVLRAYSSLPSHGKPADPEATVLAAIVLSNGASCHLVSLATGTKCLNYNTSADDTLARDLHAEVLARRAACLFLYTQFQHCLQCISCTTSMLPNYRTCARHCLSLPSYSLRSSLCTQGPSSLTETKSVFVCAKATSFIC
jgi:hypothetical protein